MAEGQRLFLVEPAQARRLLMAHRDHRDEGVERDEGQAQQALLARGFEKTRHVDHFRMTAAQFQHILRISRGIGLAENCILRNKNLPIFWSDHDE